MLSLHQAEVLKSLIENEQIDQARELALSLISVADWLDFIQEYIPPLSDPSGFLCAFGNAPVVDRVARQIALDIAEKHVSLYPEQVNLLTETIAQTRAYLRGELTWDALVKVEEAIDDVAINLDLSGPSEDAAIICAEAARTEPISSPGQQALDNILHDFLEIFSPEMRIWIEAELHAAAVTLCDQKREPTLG
ncbi:MAG: hypothetical protein AAFV53_27675 [Myxococcota bacterium]